MASPPAQPPSLQYLELVTRSQRALYGVLWSLLRDANDVDDVMQETNTVLWSKAAEYDPSREFLPWALRIAQLQVLAFRKRQKRLRRELLDDELVTSLVEDAVQDAATLEPRRRALSSCLQKLTSEQRQLVLSRYEPGASVNVIADRLKRSPKAISESLRRIRALLLDCIERTVAQEAHA